MKQLTHDLLLQQILLFILTGFCFSFATKLHKMNLQRKGRLDESGSGFGGDFLEGSGDFAPTSLCRRQEIEASAKKREPGGYIPKCNDVGDFIPRQCHPTAGEQCWCVNRYGHEISGTKHHSSISFKCLKFDETSATVYISSIRITAKPYSSFKTTLPTSRIDDVIFDETKGTKQYKNKQDQIPYENNNVDIGLANPDTNELEASMLERKATVGPVRMSIVNRPGLLAGIIGGTTLGLVVLILFVMFVVYRMRKKDEGSYALDEPKNTPSAVGGFKKSRDREFFA